MTALRLTVDEVALVLADQGRLTSATLANEAGVSGATARRVIARLRESGAIRRSSQTEPGRVGRGKRRVVYER